MSVDETLMCSFQVTLKVSFHSTPNDKIGGLVLKYYINYSGLFLYIAKFKNLTKKINGFVSYVFFNFQILKPSEKKAKYQYAGLNSGRPVQNPTRPASNSTPNKKK